MKTLTKLMNSFPFTRAGARYQSSTVIRFGILVVALLAVSTSGSHAADPKKMDITEKWQGSFPTASMKLLRKDQQASRIAFIGDLKQWAAVWEAFDPQADQPQVDFEKNIVVMVKNVRFLNSIFISGATLDTGTLKVTAGETRTARPIRDKVQCAMFVVARDGIKKITDGSKNSISLAAGALACRITIKKSEATFKNAGVWVRLWEFDPRLADASAKLFDSVKIQNVSHTAGSDSSIECQLGDETKLNKMRQYYVTVFVYKNGKIGKNKSEIFFLDGFNKVKLPGKIEGTLKKLNR
jgi:hypothetical protein